MALFDIASPDASQGYKNLKAAASDSTGGQIRHALEQMWIEYEPYADTDFREAFSIDQDPGFWEMYLTLAMLERHNEKVRKRAELTLASATRALILASRRAIGVSGSRRWLPTVATKKLTRITCPS